ncbi:MAG: hypothetical protein NWF06_11875 [Candidatus Bathyarchaeota archaeon]|nr:hypothetical protein [Candidatus Bathyarchaeum sp.]
MQIDDILTVILVLLVANLLLANNISVESLPDEDVPEKLFLKDNWKIQQSDLVPENGEQISSTEFNPTDWYSTSVPSTVLAALVENKVYPDPYYSTNLQLIPDLTTTSWWYRTEFTLPQEQNSSHVWLNFDGINFKAKIWVNKQQVADADQVQGTFRRFEFDVTNKVLFGEPNVLAVEVFAPQEGDLTNYWSDWNPNPPDKNLGLWHDVYIKMCEAVKINNIYVTADVDANTLDTAYLTVCAELTNLENIVVNGVLKGIIKNVTNTAEGGTSEGGQGVIEFSKQVTLNPNENRKETFTALQTPQLTVHNPRLWWPNLVGKQNLYDLQLEFSISNQTSDSETARFGIREVSSYISEDGYRIFTVNGKQILIRGGGWCPDMMLRPLPERKETEIKYAKDMNLNAIRMEGHLGTDHLWNMCDKYGILVLAGWSCGPLWEQWEYWDETDVQVAVQSQKDQIIRLRNHPSLLAWLYGSDKAPPAEIEAQYLNMLNTYAPTLQFLASASEQGTTSTGVTGVKMRGPYSYEPPIYYYLMESPGGAWGFGTEMGPGENVPPMESMHTMLPQDCLWPINEYWNHHCGIVAFSNISIYIDALNKRYGNASGVEDFCMKAQLMNYESMRAELEAWGWNKYVSTGVITWMYNSAWPSLIWQHYDYYLRPAGSYFGAKKACEPLHVQYCYGDDSVYVVNGLHEGFDNLEARVQVFDLELKERYSATKTVDVEADSSNHVVSIPLLQNLTTTYFVNLELRDSEENLVSSNFYWLSTQRESLKFDETYWRYTPQSDFADFSELEKLPLVELEWSYTVEYIDNEVVVHVTVENPTDCLAFFVHATVTKGLDGEEVLPILWSDNYFSLLPKESKQFDATFSVDDLNTQIPVVELGGYNVQGKFDCTQLEVNKLDNETYTVTAIVENTFVDGSKVGVYVDEMMVDSSFVWARQNKTCEVVFEIKLDDNEPHEIKVGKLTETIGDSSEPDDTYVPPYIIPEFEFVSVLVYCFVILGLMLTLYKQKLQNKHS